MDVLGIGECPTLTVGGRGEDLAIDWSLPDLRAGVPFFPYLDPTSPRKNSFFQAAYLHLLYG